MADAVYTLTAHDSKYPRIPDQVVGVYADAKVAKEAAVKHWNAIATDGHIMMPLAFTSYDSSSNTGLDFHTATGYFDYDDHNIEYSVNGFHVQTEVRMEQGWDYAEDAQEAAQLARAGVRPVPVSAEADTDGWIWQ